MYVNVTKAIFMNLADMIEMVGISDEEMEQFGYFIVNDWKRSLNYTSNNVVTAILIFVICGIMTKIRIDNDEE